MDVVVERLFLEIIRDQDDGLSLRKGFCFSFHKVPGGELDQARGFMIPLQGLRFLGREAGLQVCLRTGFLPAHINLAKGPIATPSRLRERVRWAPRESPQF